MPEPVKTGLLRSPTGSTQPLPGTRAGSVGINKNEIAAVVIRVLRKTCAGNTTRRIGDN